VSFVIVVLLTTAYQRFLEYVIHRGFHSNVLGVLHRFHGSEGHHATDGATLAPADRSDLFVAVLASVLTIATAVAEASLGLPMNLVLTSALTFALVSAVSIGAHRACHVQPPWLNRLRWFRRLCEFHRLHHNSSPPRNFMLFYPFSIDRLFGTCSDGDEPTPF
jgi:sterol desaturase/sphingolipid hydroxylase (fatty acid hydroxylase superfamily)